jgi:hypothetical protein
MKLFILILIAFLCPFGWIYINRLDSSSNNFDYSDETSSSYDETDYKNFIGNSSYSDETNSSYDETDYKNFQFSNSNKFDIIYINLIIFFIHFI